MFCTPSSQTQPLACFFFFFLLFFRIVHLDVFFKVFILIFFFRLEKSLSSRTNLSRELVPLILPRPGGGGDEEGEDAKLNLQNNRESVTIN